MVVLKIAVVLLAFFSYSASTNITDIPSYIQPCKLDDPTFETCAISVAKQVLDRYRKGDEEFHAPALTAFSLPIVIFVYGEDFSFRLKDQTTYGLDTLNILEIKKTPNVSEITATLKADKLDVRSHLYINAVIDNQRIFNNGFGNFSIYDAVFKFSFSFEPTEKDGIKTTKIYNQHSSFAITGKVTFNIDFEHVDKEEGNKINEFLTKNSDEIKKKIAPSIGVYLDEYFRIHTFGLFDEVPYARLFSE